MIRTSVKSVTRPANTTQYAAGEVMGGQLTFSIAGENGCVRSVIFCDSAAEATKPEFDLFLFTAAPTVAADNAAFAPTDAQMQDCIGVISFLAADFKTGSGNGVTCMTGLDILYSSVINRVLYGVPVTRNTYTPISAEVFTLALGTISE